jgi:hypothetical protein
MPKHKQIAALCPANAAEATLAAQFVAASEQAMDCLRLTHDPATPVLLTLKCNAQAALMMRQARGAMRTLLQVQATRRKTNVDEAAWTEHMAAQMMADALTEPPPAATTEAPKPPAEPLPPSAPPLAPRQIPPRQTSSTEVETYIHLYPQRAAAIRQAGGMPGNATFPPPDAAIIRVLTAGAAPATIN